MMLYRRKCRRRRSRSHACHPSDVVNASTASAAFWRSASRRACGGSTRGWDDARIAQRVEPLLPNPSAMVRG
jgi:hypothetical protein